MGDVTAADLTQLDTVDELLAKRLLQRGLNRGEFSRQFDKDGLARCHMAAAREYRKMLDEADEVPLIYHLLEKQRVPIPLESLNKIDLSGLDPRVVECPQGKTLVVQHPDALYGRLCVPAFKAGGVHTVVEDASGRAVPVVIHHARAASDYPAGMEVAICQPCFMTLTRPDKCVGIMVDNPAYLLDLNAAASRASDGDPTMSYPATTTAGCSEHIGPVEIGIGKEAHNDGRRGLFASRFVRRGELLLRTPALATGQNRRHLPGGNAWGLILSSNMTTRGGSLLSDHLLDPTIEDLVGNLVRLVQQHPRCAHQLYSLALSDSPTTELPPVSLFDPAAAREAVYPPLPVDVNRIRRTVLTNVAKTGDGKGSGLWALPSFLNHNCDPNCVVTYQGDVQIIHAFSDIPAGMELSVGYWDTERTWHFRQKKARGFRFVCSCPRCAYEEKLAAEVPRFADLSRQWHENYEAQLCESDLDGMDSLDDDPMPPPRARRPAPSSSGLRTELENLFQRDYHFTSATPQQKDWVRTSFSRAYSSSSSSSSSSSGCSSSDSRSSSSSSSRVGKRRAFLSVTTCGAADKYPTVLLQGASARSWVSHCSPMLGSFFPKRLSLCRPLLMKLFP